MVVAPEGQNARSFVLARTDAPRGWGCRAGMALADAKAMIRARGRGCG